MKGKTFLLMFLLAWPLAAQDQAEQAKQFDLQPVTTVPQGDGTWHMEAVPESPQEQPAAKELQIVSEVKPVPLSSYTLALIPPITHTEQKVLVLINKPNEGLQVVTLEQELAAIRAGGKEFTLKDLVDDLNKEEKMCRDLQEDYDRLVARYNRLAAISDQQPVQVQVQPQPARDDSRLLKMMILQQMFSKPSPMRIDMRVSDCTKYPALCVGP